MPSFPVVGEQFVRDTLPLVDLGYIRQCQDSDMSAFEPPANGCERRQRHDGVAHPIRCANEQPHESELRRPASMRSIDATNSLSELIARSINAMYIGSLALNSGTFC